MMEQKTIRDHKHETINMMEYKTIHDHNMMEHKTIRFRDK